jgi:putative chitinase
MLDDERLGAIMPGASATRRRDLLPFLQAAMTEFAIDAPAREAAFIAQLAHESGQFRFMEEIWGPTDAQRRYEPPSTLATTLGNTQPGDGRRFKGRGPIQITGRANYQRFGGLLGIDLVADPPRAALPDVAFRIAGLFWSKKGLNELADRASPEAFREITRRINGGFNGLADRQKFYESACRVLSVSAPSIPRGGPSMAPASLPDEPVFERGFEAIAAAGPAPRARKAPAAKRPRKAAPAAKRPRKAPAKKRSKVSAARRKPTVARRKPVTKTTTRRRTTAKRSKSGTRKR